MEFYQNSTMILDVYLWNASGIPLECCFKIPAFFLEGCHFSVIKTLIIMVISSNNVTFRVTFAFRTAIDCDVISLYWVGLLLFPISIAFYIIIIIILLFPLLSLQISSSFFKNILFFFFIFSSLR